MPQAATSPGSTSGPSAFSRTHGGRYMSCHSRAQLGPVNEQAVVVQRPLHEHDLVEIATAAALGQVPLRRGGSGPARTTGQRGLATPSSGPRSSLRESGTGRRRRSSLPQTDASAVITLVVFPAPAPGHLLEPRGAAVPRRHDLQPANRGSRAQGDPLRGVRQAGNAALTAAACTRPPSGLRRRRQSTPNPPYCVRHFAGASGSRAGPPCGRSRSCARQSLVAEPVS